MGIFRPNIYGDTLQWISVYNNTQIAQTIPSRDNPVQLARGTLANPIITSYQKNMPIATDGVITVKVSGRFMVQVHCSFSGSSNDDYTLYWRKNGTNLSDGKVKWTQKNGSLYAVSSQTMMDLIEDDTLDVQIENNTDGTDINLDNFSQVIFKMW